MIQAVNGWRKQYPKIALVVALCVLITSAAAAGKVINDNRWWVWLSEWVSRNKTVDNRFEQRALQVDGQFTQIRADMLATSREQLRTRRDVLRGQLWHVEKEIREAERAGKTVNESLHRERVRLQDAIEGIRIRLVGNRGRAP